MERAGCGAGPVDHAGHGGCSDRGGATRGAALLGPYSSGQSQALRPGGWSMKRRAYTSWTWPQLRDIQARRGDGESWDSICNQYGVTQYAIRQTLRRYGMGVGKLGPGDDRPNEAMVLEAIRLRNDCRTWSSIARVVSWPGTWQALRKACWRSARLRGGSVWCGRGVPA